MPAGDESPARGAQSRRFRAAWASAAAALALVWLAPGGAALAANACAGLKPFRAEAETRLEAPEPTIRDDIPYDTVRRFEGASRAVLLGVTMFTKNPHYDFEARAEPAPDGDGVCLALEQVSILIRYDVLQIAIANHVHAGSCTYDVTMEHERAHVAYELGAVQKALKEVEREIRKPRRHYHGDTEAEARAKAAKQVERWAKKAYDRADRVARRGHNYMDIQSNIRGSLARCKDWRFK